MVFAMPCSAQHNQLLASDLATARVTSARISPGSLRSFADERLPDSGHTRAVASVETPQRC